MLSLIEGHAVAQTQIAGELKMDPCVIEGKTGMAHEAMF
jgi:hypothetical protein